MISCERSSKNTSGVLVITFGNDRDIEGLPFSRSFEGRSSPEPDDLCLVSTRWMEAGASRCARHRGCGKERSWRLCTGFYNSSSAVSLKSLTGESDHHQTSFMFNVASTSKNETMLPSKSQVLPSRKDDRVILHFDCRYIDLHGTIYNMQLADSAAQR